VQSLAVAVTVPDGPHAVDPALSRASASTRIRVVAVEVPLAGHSPDDVGRLSQRRGGAAPARYVEVPVANVTGETVAVLRAAGLHLKLRTGGTTGAAFPTESDLTHAILRCVTNEASFKCTAGLHYAVRHRDPETGFEHHGFLNVALATLAALQTGDAAAVRDQLVEQDAAAVAKRTAELDTADIAAIRSRFGSFGTCSIADPLADLARMGLVSYR